MSWLGRTRELYAELGAIAQLDASWWLLAGAAAAAELMPARASYVISDAGPATDTFIGHRAEDPIDAIADAIASAHAARAAIKELDGKLPDQPLAVTIDRSSGEARCTPSNLEVAAFAIGNEIVLARLAARVEQETTLAMKLFDAIRRARHAQLLEGIDGKAQREDATETTVSPAGTPFICVSVGEDRLTVARHGHRRAWKDERGPWLGIGRVGGLATVSTCHLVIDGYGHAWLASRIVDLRMRLTAIAPGSPSSTARRVDDNDASGASRFVEPSDLRGEAIDLPHLSLVKDAIPLGVAWRELSGPAPRALALAYAVGRVLHRVAGNSRATFSPTFQIPVAPGDITDAERLKKRVVVATLSVRFVDGVPEPFADFAPRAKTILTREASGQGLVTRLLAAARAVPVPLAFKRRSLSTSRPAWFERLAEVIGGRACVSKISLATPSPFACAVSSPARMASLRDRIGGCVITIVDDGARASITACGSGLAGDMDDAADLIDEVLALYADVETSMNLEPLSSSA
ncbi:MAG TPA: hypothetical protein VGM90_17115 [Kofleriaceae bacterium]|jgi:hypothetical protein